jgi:hypothetical protein
MNNRLRRLYRAKLKAEETALAHHTEHYSSLATCIGRGR